MAERPVYMVEQETNSVKRITVEFVFCPGFSIKQKQKSIANLHNNFKEKNPDLNILEVSSKSSEELGVKLSAFNLTINTGDGRFCFMENLFQSAKVFENGGPYEDLLFKTPGDAKKDQRLRGSGELTGFRFKDRKYPTEPKTMFYNWLYLHALYQKQNRDLMREIIRYDAFTDIEFNPKKSINCQAEACAHFVSLYRRNRLVDALKSMDVFEKELYGDNAKNREPTIENLLDL